MVYPWLYEEPVKRKEHDNIFNIQHSNTAKSTTEK